MDSEPPYLKECEALRSKLGAKGVFIIAVDPIDNDGKVVCGGTLSVDMGMRLLECLRALETKIERDLNEMIMQTSARGDHINN